ncbi:type 1 glutamine amidotransferase [Roseobacter sp. SK209-2-6]|uniref:type 1 glutamine amidotransferase n=1 Tax=Roseobacter sp. SK209-2-6 TaxID=388739 RepID=UPI0002E00F44|nr:type 1 glutamine amidotransferase [Roseobacter sp. SK209-2-6]
MRLAILVTNTDQSSFAERHPKDAEKFTDLIRLVRPNWQLSAFQVHMGEFPDDLERFDGAMITGSPTSTRAGLPWIEQLLELIRGMERRKQPLFGACFGHQACALALGGKVSANPQGWVHGLVGNTLAGKSDWTGDLPGSFALYGSHCEHVSKLPERAVEMALSSGLNAGFRIDGHLWTSQHHPEMSHEFISALTGEMCDTLGQKAHDKALESLTKQADQAEFAECIARFFEQATELNASQGGA